MGEVERRQRVANHQLQVILVAWDETNFVYFQTNRLAITIFAHQESLRKIQKDASCITPHPICGLDYI